MASDDDRLSGPLQESVLTLLLFDKQYGGVAAGMVLPEHFDLRFRDLAKHALAYRRSYRKPPGMAHIDDIFDHVLGDKKNENFKSYSRILTAVVEQAQHLNAEYVSTRVSEFVRRQTLKSAVFQAGERYAQGGDGIVTDVENILYKALKSKNPDMDIGLYLGDKKNIARILNQTGVSFYTGISELDQLGFGLTKKKIVMFTGVKGAGKSWWLTHLGRNALMQHGRGVHISLEMPQEEVIARYYRNFFAIGKREEKFTRVSFELDSLGKLKDFREVEGTTAKRRLTDPKIKSFLEERLVKWRGIMDNLVVKSFPSGTLNMRMLEAYLDMLANEGFYPDFMLLDYPLIMEHPRDHLRESLGRTLVELRGLMDERNMAGGVAGQSNRAGAQSKTVEDTNIAEDWSQGFTYDMGCTFSQTKQEKAMNLARLLVDKNRGDADKFTVLISQNYAQGQFCVDSVLMEANRYWDKLKEYSGEEE